MVWTGIAIFYFMCLAFGFLFALIGAIFGALGGHFHIEAGGHHADFGQSVSSSHGFDSADHGADVGNVDSDHMPGASVLNTITVSTFIGFFGISGLLAVWGLRMGPLVSLAFALPVSLLIAAGQFILYVKVFIKAQASSEATLSETLGCEAVVIASIPAERVGQISYAIKGSRYTAPATSADGEDIARGSKVRVVNIRGAVLVVRPL